MVFRSVKGSVVESSLSVLFNIGIAVVVGVALMSAIGEFGTSDAYETNYLATDLGLLLDALGGVREDVLVEVNYLLPVDFQGKVSPRRVEVWEGNPAAPGVFWFSENQGDRYAYGDLSGSVRLFRLPGSIGVGEVDVTKGRVLCARIPSRVGLTSLRVERASGGVVDVASGSGLVKLSLAPSQAREVRVFVSSSAESADVGCVIAQEISKLLPLDGVAVIPQEPGLVNTIQSEVFAKEIGVFVDAKVPESDFAQVLRGAYEGVRVVG